MTKNELRGIIVCVCGGRECGICPLYGDCVAPPEEKVISVARKLFFAYVFCEAHYGCKIHLKTIDKHGKSVLKYI